MISKNQISKISHKTKKTAPHKRDQDFGGESTTLTPGKANHKINDDLLSSSSDEGFPVSHVNKKMKKYGASQVDLPKARKH
jgi:hypothetical protein